MTFTNLKVVVAARVAVCLFAVFPGAGAQVGAPTVERVVQPPALKALAMSVVGRAVITPAASGGDFGDHAAQWPGSYFEAAFKGTEVFFRVGTAHEILHVVVDGRDPLVLRDPQAGVYRISSLQNVKHSIGVFVVTESMSAPNHFEGFGITAKERGLAPAKRLRQIEFIGDSITVGYGNTSPKQECTADDVWATTDNTQAFGPLTASHFHADYQVNAISGRGIVRNYNGFAGDTLPAVYPYILFDKKQEYSDPAWKPQLMVIALGANDFSTQLNAGEKWKSREELRSDYEATFVRFLQSLRARNPAAYIVLWGTGWANSEVLSEEQRVADRMKALGENRIAFVPVEHLSFTGCNFHPSVADDKVIRDKLVQFIDAHPDIWQGR